MGLVVRDTKFRAWDNNEEWMVDDMLLSFDGEILTDDVQPHDTPYKEIELADEGRYELMQYTGMKDINGSEIYEEDIVKYGEDVYTIKYGRFIDMDVPTPITQIGFYLLDNKYQETFPLYAVEYKILGNIYENKDLLKG